MKWLVTGGCGFIGTSLIKTLLSMGGHSIRVVDNLSTGTREDLSSVCSFTEVSEPGADLVEGVHFLRGDVRDFSFAMQASSGVEIVVHLAANTGIEASLKDPVADFTANAVGTLNYLEAARRNEVKRFVFASSGASIGDCSPPIHEDMPSRPKSPYGAGKLSGEGYCSAYYKSYGIETVALRFGNVYGPGSGHKNSIVAKFIKQAMNRETLEIYGNGKQTRDFIYINDIVGAILAASLAEGVGGEIFQIASASETTISELTDMLLAVLFERGIKGVRLRHSVARVGDVVRNFSDTSKAESLLGWKASVALDAGLRRTVEWFLAESKIDNLSPRVVLEHDTEKFF